MGLTSHMTPSAPKHRCTICGATKHAAQNCFYNVKNIHLHPYGWEPWECGYCKRKGHLEGDCLKKLNDTRRKGKKMPSHNVNHFVPPTSCANITHIPSGEMEGGIALRAFGIGLDTRQKSGYPHDVQNLIHPTW